MADDEEDAWADELDGKAQPNVGMSKDVLRKARALNPQLASQGSTTELFSKMKKGVAVAEEKKAKGENALLGNADFAKSFYELRDRHKQDRQRVQDEISRLQRQLAEIPTKSLERIVDLIIEIDPNMVSPQTQEILKSETPFLNEIGFSVRKVIDKKMKKK